MKLVIRVLLFCVLACGSVCSLSQADSAKTIQVRRVVIESNSLPERDRRQIVRQFEGCSYEGAAHAVAEEFGERIRMALRELGYFQAAADDPKMSFVASDRRKRTADVRVKVREGVQYRLGEIQFNEAQAF